MGGRHPPHRQRIACFLFVEDECERQNQKVKFGVVSIFSGQTGGRRGGCNVQSPAASTLAAPCAALFAALVNPLVRASV